MRDAVVVDRVDVPERALNVLQDFGEQLLPPEPGALEARDNVVEEALREVGAVVVRATARDDSRRVLGQRPDEVRRAGRRRYAALRVPPEAKPEQEHVESRLGVAPCRKLVAPCKVRVLATEAVRLVRRVRGRGRAILPGQAPLRRLVDGAVPARRYRQDSAVTLDHDVAHVCGSRPDERYIPMSVFSLPDEFRARSRFAKTPPRK